MAARRSRPQTVKVPVMAEAAKMARIAWAVLTSGERYAPRTAA